MKKLWEGRFVEGTNPDVEQFTESISIDSKLYEQDIRGSLAHAGMLNRQGYISDAEFESIRSGLERIKAELAEGKLEFGPSDEDIHMFIESVLIERIGDAGKKLHTARSRNDQVCTDVRLYMLDKIDEVVFRLEQLRLSLLGLAEREKDTIMPGYTHMQQAQPVLFAHHMLAYVEILARDIRRFQNARVTTDMMPLGACAMAGTSLDTDREFVRAQLGFAKTMENSMDAVAARDHIQETLAAVAICGVTLSRMCEEFVLWSSQEFSFISIGDAFCTGSSIMPQKKNPDVAEIVRGKSGRFVGNLMSILTMVKGLPLTYNRDLQEDKYPLMDSLENLIASLHVLAGMVSATKVNRKRTQTVFCDDYMLATDLAEYLVNKGMPFRQAHHVVGSIIKDRVEKGAKLADFTLEQIKTFSELFDQDALDALTLEGSVKNRNSFGGTGYERVHEQLKKVRKEIEEV